MNIRFKYWKKHTPIFIIASPRSGTTWLSKALNYHPSIFCTERRLFGNYADFVEDEGSDHPRLRVTLDKYVQSLLLHHGLPMHQSNSLTKALIQAIESEEQKFSRKKIVIDKITPYLGTSTLVYDSIKEHFPNAKFIFLVRDGRDVCTSGVFHWFNKQLTNTKLTDFELHRRAYFLDKDQTKPLTRFFTDSEIEEWTCFWKDSLSILHNTAQDNKNYLILKYEDMLSDQYAVLEKIFSFIGAKESEQLIKQCIKQSSFTIMSDGRKKGVEKPGAHIRKGVAGDWKNYFTKWDGELFAKLAGEQLITHHYESSNNWVNDLPDSLTFHAKTN